METQQTIDEIDTDLSLAADQMLTARRELNDAKEFETKASEKFIEQMIKSNKDKVTHEGRTLSIVRRQAKTVVKVGM